MNTTDEYGNHVLANLAYNLIIRSNLYDTSDVKIPNNVPSIVINHETSDWKHGDKEVCGVIADYHAFYVNIDLMMQIKIKTRMATRIKINQYVRCKGSTQV